ncbi:MAG: ThuA domain-containing protein [Chloroflexota bacterium]|nr:ThuA domain-containing protein [Chloroflexota bacterium]
MWDRRRLFRLAALSALAAQGAPARLLVVTATSGFEHASIPVAREVLQRLGHESGAYRVTVLPDVASLDRLSPETLAVHDAVFFANTSGELPLTATQKHALLDFVAGGGGFLGTHSASDTLYSWPEYGALVGAYFLEHPWTQPAEVTVEHETHPLTEGLRASFVIEDEFYVFRTNPRPRARVLLSLLPESVGIAGPADYPLSWCARYGAGRSFYTALGHDGATWEDPRLQRHLLAAVQWATGRLEAPSDPLA